MTEPQLNVEYEELMSRAAELEEPMPPIPDCDLAPPSFIRMTVVSEDQLKLSVGNMRLYISRAEAEWARLGESLREAAKAYEETSEAAAKAVTEGTDIEPALPRSVDFIDISDLGPTPNAANNGGATGGFPNSWENDTGSGQRRAGRGNEGHIGGQPDDYYPDGGNEDYYEVRQAASDMEESDQGASYRVFAQDWDDYQRALQAMSTRFRPFDSWDGEAREIVEQSFEAQREWIIQMANLCATLASQATHVVDAQRYGYQEHPTSYSLASLDSNYAWLTSPDTDLGDKYTRIRSCIRQYDEYQQKSEDVLAQYRSRGSLPLTPVNPVKPPVGGVDLPDIGGGAGGGTDYFDDLDDVLGGLNIPSGLNPDTDTLTDALSSALSKDPLAGLADPSVKAASLGGAGGGAMPLKPPIEHGAAGGASTAGTGAGTAPAAGAGAGAGAGRGGGGMAPMGGGAGQGQQGGKAGKRAQKDEEALYTEERPWTEPVVGNRRRSDAPGVRETG